MYYICISNFLEKRIFSQLKIFINRRRTERNTNHRSVGEKDFPRQSNIDNHFSFTPIFISHQSQPAWGRRIELTSTRSFVLRKSYSISTINKKNTKVIRILYKNYDTDRLSCSILSGSLYETFNFHESRDHARQP